MSNDENATPGDVGVETPPAETPAPTPAPAAAPSPAPGPVIEEAVTVARLRFHDGSSRVVLLDVPGSRPTPADEGLALLATGLERMRLDLVVNATSDAVLAKLSTQAEQRRIMAATVAPRAPLSLVRR